MSTESSLTQKTTAANIDYYLRTYHMNIFDDFITYIRYAVDTKLCKRKKKIVMEEFLQKTTPIVGCHLSIITTPFIWVELSRYLE